jgi:hypothetical protein
LLIVNPYNLGVIYSGKGEKVKRNWWFCVSQMKMSSLTAKLKCPPTEKGKDKVESEAVTEISGHGFGGGWKVRGGELWPG